MPLFCRTSLIDCCVQCGVVRGIKNQKHSDSIGVLFSCEGGGYYVKVMSVLWEDS